MIYELSNALFKLNFFYHVGMQSSLLGLALANRFFEDPVVGVPPAISVSRTVLSMKFEIGA